MPDSGHGGAFPATRFSVLAAARSPEASERAVALDALFTAYWKPVYKFVRLRWSRSPEDAQDLTQGFFAELFERQLLTQFDPAKSHLRTYLRVCLQSFVLNQDKAASRQKRGGNIEHFALDAAAAEAEMARTLDPAKLPSPETLETFFEKEWIRNLFTLAVEDLRGLAESKNKRTAFALFERYDLDGDASASYAELASQYAIAVTDVTNNLAWARREFKRLALDRLQSLCGSEAEFEHEARALFGWSPR